MLCRLDVSFGAGAMRNKASVRPTKLSNMSVILPEQIISPRSPLYIAQEMTPVKTEIQPDSKAAAQISGKKKQKKKTDYKHTTYTQF